ncbi:hypothetical protein CDAR_598351 [Caerostris darwini]|uniref:Uncharacterized protein n=1 Tax=Caerostris darwini TaxID=1538125 RepID=A0AAV4QNG0_9ARAC|nr:hypothetical protein CDAR_598351 [Caerostris darwini]
MKSFNPRIAGAGDYTRSFTFFRVKNYNLNSKLGPYPINMLYAIHSGRMQISPVGDLFVEKRYPSHDGRKTFLRSFDAKQTFHIVS